jgi:hypothetical protein
VLPPVLPPVPALPPDPARDEVGPPPDPCAPGADDCDPWVDDEPCPDAVEPAEGDCPAPAGWPLEPLLPEVLPDDPLEFVPAGALLPGVLPAEPPAPPLVGFDGNGDSGPPPWLEL